MLRRGAPGLPFVLLALAASVVVCQDARASPSVDACAQVNAGYFDLTNSGSSSSDLNGFVAGQVVTFVITGTGGYGFIFIDNVEQDEFFPSSTAHTYRQTMDDPAQMLGTFFRGTGGYRITLRATCSSGDKPSPTNSDASRGLVKSFLAARINGILLNDPGATSLLNRYNPSGPTGAGNGTTNVASSTAAFGGAIGFGSVLGNAMGLGANRLGDDSVGTSGGKSIQFSQSLSQMRRQAAQSQLSKDRMALGAGDGGSLPLAYETASPWDIWVEGRYSAFDDDNGNWDRDGHVGVLYVGGDYRIAENMIVGVLAQFDWAKDDSGVLASKVDGNGWMIGPYMSARIHDNIYFDLRAAWGHSDNDIDVAGATGSFDTSRWLVKGTLAGNWTHDAWRITPSAELAYITESADSFTNSAGTFVAGQDVSLGRLQFGPEIGYRFAHTADTFIEPFAAIKGLWDFDNPNVAIIDGYVVGPGDFWGRLQGGLNVATTSGWYVRGLASWDGLGTSDYSGYTLQGTVNVPLN